MRKLFVSMLAAAALAVGTETSSAADGCSYDYYGNIICAPGAQPGVPYYRGGYGYYGGGPYYYDRPRYDPGAAIALGVIGAAAAAIASQPRYHRYPKRYRYRR